jgi:hypothetical protein
MILIVDDLLNRELIRKDYKFKSPIIPKDLSDDEDEELEEAKIEDNVIHFEDNLQKVTSNTPGKKK